MNYLKKCFHYFKGRLESIYFRKYYLSIHVFPAKQWIAMHQNDDLTQLSRSGKICKRAPIVFDKIRDEIIDTFGLSLEFVEIQRSIIKLELLKCELMRTKNKILKFHIKMQEDYLKNLMHPGKKTDMFEAIIWAKKQGVAIDEEKVSVFWFLTTMKYLTKDVKKEKAAA